MHQQNYVEGEYHLKLKLSGNAKKIQLFHTLLGDMDSKDYPFHLTRKNYKECVICGGAIYTIPRFRIQHLLGMARQINLSTLLPGNLKLKVKRFCTAEHCWKDAQEQRAKREEKDGGPLRPPLVEVVK